MITMRVTHPSQADSTPLLGPSTPSVPGLPSAATMEQCATAGQQNSKAAEAFAAWHDVPCTFAHPCMCIQSLPHPFLPTSSTHSPTRDEPRAHHAYAQDSTSNE